MLDLETAARAAAEDVVVRPLDLAQIHRAAGRRRARVRAGVASAVVVAAGAALAIPTLSGAFDRRDALVTGAHPTPDGTPSPGAADAIPGVRTYDNLKRNHVPGPVSYPQQPPVGGPHSAQTQTCGLYSEPIGNVTAVHSLEHGAVWIAYGSQVSDADITTLAGLLGLSPYRLMSPYPELGHRIALQAWGTQLFVDSASDPRIKQFLDRYTEGPQTPEMGAGCRGTSETVRSPDDVPGSADLVG